MVSGRHSHRDKGWVCRGSSSLSSPCSMSGGQIDPSLFPETSLLSAWPKALCHSRPPDLRAGSAETRCVQCVSRWCLSSSPTVISIFKNRSGGVAQTLASGHLEKEMRVITHPHCAHRASKDTATWSLSLLFKEHFHWWHGLESRCSGPGRALFPPVLTLKKDDVTQLWLDGQEVSLSIHPPTYPPIHPSTHSPLPHPSMWADREIVPACVCCQFLLLYSHLFLIHG